MNLPNQTALFWPPELLLTMPPVYRGWAVGVTARVGPRLATLFAESGIEPLEVQPFPVSISRLGPPDKATWQNRRSGVEVVLTLTADPAVQKAGRRYLDALTEYEKSVQSADAGFVELQNTLLFAVLGQRTDAPSK